MILEQILFNREKLNLCNVIFFSFNKMTSKEAEIKTIYTLIKLEDDCIDIDYDFNF